MNSSAVQFQALNEVWVAVIAILGLLAIWLTWRSARSLSGRGWVSWFCPLLKLTAIALLLLMLLNPVVTGKVARKGANDFLILMDSGQSMAIHGGDGLREELLDAARKPGSWLAKLDEEFRLEKYFFTDRMRKWREVSEISFEGNRSDLLHALDQIGQRYAKRPLAGVLLFSDGQATDAEQLRQTTFPVPIYPVLCQSDESIRDVAIQGIAVSSSDFEDAPVTMAVSTRGRNLAGKKVELKVVDERGEEMAHEEHKLGDEDEEHGFQIRFRPLRPGVTAYEVSLSLEGEEPVETTRENNQRTLSIDRGQGPYRVLYVSGRPNWDYKFLRRSVVPDEEVQLVGLVRVAKREPKFEWRGRRGESSNPLFRGFQDQLPEEEAGHDQPVLIRLNTRDSEELRTGFPKEREELFGNYHAVVLDDLEAEFFTEDQQLLLEKFVSVRGGSLLMMGGQESLQLGGYRRTTLGQMLPVYLEEGAGRASPQNSHLKLTREGWLEPWVRLRLTESEEEIRLAHMPAFRSIHRIGAVKPGASVLAMAVDEEQGSFPALAVHTYGEGRVAALPMGDVWRWGMEDEELREDMERWWRQVIRWLVADVPRFVQVETEWEDERLAKRMVSVRVRKDSFRVEENATVELVLRQTDMRAEAEPVNGEPELESESGREVEGEDDALRMFAEPSLDEPGLYRSEITLSEPGAYHLEVVVKDENGERLGTGEAGWSWNPAEAELASLEANPEFLHEVAEKSGGRLLKKEDVASFVRDLPNLEVPLQETWVRPVWHQPWIFLLVLVLFFGEWGLRRWKGLA